MAKRKGQVVTSTLVTPDTTCTFPVVNVNDVGGGRLIVTSLAERNAIPPKFRMAGMVVRVQGTIKKDYELLAGYSATGTLVDADWKEYTAGVPDGVLTKHQTAEEVKYGDPNAAGFPTLLAKLADIDSKIAACLTEHQKVEDIVYQTPVSITGGTTNSLLAKLADMDSKIGAAAAIPDIEAISWGSVPSDGHNHAATLAGELEKIYTDMNDPTKITVTKADTTTTNLQAMISYLEGKTPTVEDISNTAGIPLTVLLADASDVTKIPWPGGTNLKAKIDSLSSAVAGVNVETITWSTTPSTPAGVSRNKNLSNEINTLFGYAADMNDPTKIIVDNSTNKDLITKLGEIDVAISAAGLTPNIESISWAQNPPPAGHSANLGDDLKAIVTNIAAIQNDMNDPTKIIVDTSTTPQTTLADKLAELSDMTVEKIKWNTTPAAATGGMARANALKDELNNIVTQINTINASLADMNDPTKIMVAAGKNLSTKLSEIDSTLADMNDPDKIQVLKTPGAGSSDPDYNVKVTLSSKLAAIQDGRYCPQYLLYNTSAPETGSLTSQEFLTTFTSKICEIAVYTNSDATISGDITITLEKCESSSTTYTAITGTSVTLNSSDTGLMDRVDLSNLSTPITIPDNCRLRINITAYNTANVVDVLNVRVKLMQYI